MGKGGFDFLKTAAWLHFLFSAAKYRLPKDGFFYMPSGNERNRLSI